MEDTRRTRTSNSTEQNSYEFTETETANTGPAWVLTRSLEYEFQFNVFMGLLSV